LLALGLAITYRIEHSWMGYYLVAIGEDEDAAQAIGVNAPRVKRDIYMISAFLTALAGTFYVQYIYFIDPATAFSFNISVEAALVVRNLSKRFGGLRAVQDLSFSVREGETLALIGPNGAGKTTSFNLVTGFQRADSGSVLAFGGELVGRPAHQVCALGVARTFQ